MNCIFCKIKDYVIENDKCYAVFDKMPVNEGHMLIILKRHAQTFFDTTKDERAAMFDLVDEAKKLLDAKYHPDGYNVGVNCGQVAGQSVPHVHIHVIPRYVGDTKFPIGGVRGVVPERMGETPAKN